MAHVTISELVESSYFKALDSVLLLSLIHTLSIAEVFSEQETRPENFQLILYVK